MFRRRRAADTGNLPPAEGPDDPQAAGGPTQDEETELPGGRAAGTGREHGPWDLADSYPQRERIDLGSLRIPAEPGVDVRVGLSGDQPIAVLVERGDSALRLQAFAAPKRTGLWDDVRHELIEELQTAGGRFEETEGPFGPEVRAQVPAQHGSGASRRPESARFLGVDGPRWFLHGVLSGPAAVRPNQAKVFEDVFADVVVIRGDHPVPPRDMLELRLPQEVQQAIDEQKAKMAQPPDRSRLPDLFARGPEITETR